MWYIFSGKALLLSRAVFPPAACASVYMGLLGSYAIVPHLSSISHRLSSLETVKIESSMAQATVSGVELSQCILLFLCRILWFLSLARVKWLLGKHRASSWITDYPLGSQTILLDHRERMESGKPSPMTESSRRARHYLKKLPSKIMAGSPMGLG